MSVRRYEVGQAVFDRDRQAHGDVVGLCPSPLVVRLLDAAGFQWIARTVARECTGPAADLIVAPGLDRYNATASALNSAG
ncbi:hypothetical protein [Streptomyces lavendulae]|uniref:hypothetical protein n=1 Tax=Streptomyces lavendulae TaxID=1914 RepID=UPI0033E6F3B9